MFTTDITCLSPAFWGRIKLSGFVILKLLLPTSVSKNNQKMPSDFPNKESCLTDLIQSNRHEAFHWYMIIVSALPELSLCSSTREGALSMTEPFLIIVSHQRDRRMGRLLPVVLVITYCVTNYSPNLVTLSPKCV